MWILHTNLNVNKEGRLGWDVEPVPNRYPAHELRRYEGEMNVNYPASKLAPIEMNIKILRHVL